MQRLVLGEGDIFAKLIIIGEAPGAQEDLEGRPFIGKSGKLLRNLLIESGINPSEDVYFCNVIKSRPPNNRKPTQSEIFIHRPWVLKQIELVDPELVILVGSTAMRTILEVKKPISTMRGKFIFKNKREYISIFHPSYLLRFSRKVINNPYGLTLKDLQNVRSKLNHL